MSFAILAILLWLLIAGIWWIATGSLRDKDARKIQRRILGSAREPRTKKDLSSASPLIAAEDHAKGKWILRILKRLELQDRLMRSIEQAGLKWNAARVIHACLALFLAGFTVLRLLLPTSYQFLAILPAILLGGVPLLVIARTRARRLNKFEALFPDSLEFVARSMRAGHAFSVSLEMIHREFQEPLAGEFRRTFEEHNLGLPLDTALQKFAQRVPSLDVHFFVSAVLLQKRTGGNLAEILDKLAYLIRERFKLRGKIRAISAHGRMTGTALSLIPVGVAAIMLVVNPDYVKFFVRDEVGNYMAGGAVLLQLIGYGVIRKIVQIEI